MSSIRRNVPVLGTPVAVATYEDALTESLRLASLDTPAAVSACNTHLVALARHDENFGKVLREFDLILPDGYPLIWAMNKAGAGLADRVYGPYFMKYVMANSPATCRHFFFGGSPATLEKLETAAKRLNPKIQIAGKLSPPFRAWTEEDEQDFAKTIRDAAPDFIWVALGGERQERWIKNNLHRHDRGVFFAVGDAFELLAGGRPFAPPWMQERGLTWLYRLMQEPRRLWPRYLKFNSLFLYYVVRDSLLGSPIKEMPRIAFLGSRGVPARYSGFEVVVENLGAQLVARGYQVTVYNRVPKFTSGTSSYLGMRLVTLPTIPTKSLDTIVHTALSALHALFQRYDIIYLCGVGNTIVGGGLKAIGYPVILNVDGADFRRSKWGTFARLWLKSSEAITSRCANSIIADNQEIVRRYERSYGVKPEYISYGAIIRREKISCGELEHWGLKPRGYILNVSRITPENEADLLIEAFTQWKGDLKLVICGSSNYERAFQRKLERMADDRVIFTGARFGDSYLELSQNAAFFVMPAAIEATRLVLLDQMGMGAAILYKEAPATREVLGDAAESFQPGNPVSALTEKIAELAGNPDRCAELGRLAIDRAERLFSWSEVTSRYERLFEEIGVKKP